MLLVRAFFLYIHTYENKTHPYFNIIIGEKSAYETFKIECTSTTCQVNPMQNGS